MGHDALKRAADAVARAEAMVVGAGAGMGVDSGLPDFRGDEGFWRAYPPFADAGLSFTDLANPTWFAADPELAWGFYGHRMLLYRRTRPHPGFTLLLQWAERLAHGAFVFTSNVDGQFQAAGFEADQLMECHGSIHHLQCSRGCTDDIWEADGCTPRVDEATFRAAAPLPGCRRCDVVARPNILMFGDAHWHAQRTHAQRARLQRWLDDVEGKPAVVVECGAGTAVPTVRWICEQLANQLDAPLIRINPREPQGPPGTISIPTGALDALQGIEPYL